MGKDTKIIIVICSYLLAILFLVLSVIEIVGLSDYIKILNEDPNVNVFRVDIVLYILVGFMFIIFLTDVIVFMFLRENGKAAKETYLIIQVFILCVLIILYFILSISSGITSEIDIFDGFSRLLYFYLIKNCLIKLIIFNLLLIIGDFICVFIVRNIQNSTNKCEMSEEEAKVLKNIEDVKQKIKLKVLQEEYNKLTKELNEINN